MYSSSWDCCRSANVKSFINWIRVFENIRKFLFMDIDTDTMHRIFFETHLLIYEYHFQQLFLQGFFHYSSAKMSCSWEPAFIRGNITLFEINVVFPEAFYKFPIFSTNYIIRLFNHNKITLIFKCFIYVTKCNNISFIIYK